jgi:uncharacterized protein (TIGR00299 family) protein
VSGVRAWFDCVSGISGDMTLAALVAAGWPEEELQAIPGRLRLEDVSITVREVKRGAFAARHVEVKAPAKQPHRHLRHIHAILDAADLPAGVADRARDVFGRLASAEAEVHGSTPEKVHFHEVGAVDALVDIVGAAAGLAALGVTETGCSELPLGGGTVVCEHGRIPVPAPATALLLRGAQVLMGPVEAELVTPTGAALLASLTDGWRQPSGSYRLERTGIGAGTREFPDHPNVLRLLVGSAGSRPAVRRVAVLETAVDDENPQLVADLAPRLLAAGALDVMLVPAIMKKGRPGSWLVVIAEPSNSERLAGMIMASISTLGVRVREEGRFELERREESVSTAYGEVRLKIALLPDGSSRAQPEYESVRAAAERAGAPLREVSEAALAAWRSVTSAPHSGA